MSNQFREINYLTGIYKHRYVSASVCVCVYEGAYESVCVWFLFQ